MGLLKNLPFMPNMGFKGPQDILMRLLNIRPDLQNAMREVNQMSQGNPEAFKEIVLKDIRSGNISKEQFNEFKNFANTLGMDKDVISTLEENIK